MSPTPQMASSTFTAYPSPWTWTTRTHPANPWRPPTDRPICITSTFPTAILLGITPLPRIPSTPSARRHQHHAKRFRLPLYACTAPADDDHHSAPTDDLPTSPPYVPTDSNLDSITPQSPPHSKSTMNGQPHTQNVSRNNSTNKNKDGKETTANTSGRRKRVMSPESRAKISAALKGRRKSAAHRENLRKRFEGNQNPMYGRKLSAETRAKISRSLRRRHSSLNTTQTNGNPSSQMGNENNNDSNVTDSNNSWTHLRDEVMRSRFVASLQPGVSPPPPSDRRPNGDDASDNIDAVLQRVANFNSPPESVSRLRQKAQNRRECTLNTDSETPSETPSQTENTVLPSSPHDPSNNDDNGSKDKNTERQRIDHISERVRPDVVGGGIIGRRKGTKKSKKSVDEGVRTMCNVCGGSGMMRCSQCVGAFGVVSERCVSCFGAGAVYCETCQGIGQIV